MARMSSLFGPTDKGAAPPAAPSVAIETHASYQTPHTIVGVQNALPIEPVNIPPVNGSSFILPLQNGTGYRVSIYDEIYNIQEYTNLLALLHTATEDMTIEIWISSPGGEVMAGLLVASAIMRSKAKVVTIALDCIASMASSIWVAGDELVIDEDATVMFHQASCMYYGKTRSVLNQAASMDTYVQMVMFEEAKKKGLLLEDEFKEVIERGRDVFIPASTLLNRGVARLKVRGDA